MRSKKAGSLFRVGGNHAVADLALAEARLDSLGAAQERRTCMARRRPGGFDELFGFLGESIAACKTSRTKNAVFSREMGAGGFERELMERYSRYND